MIRTYQITDTDAILDAWLQASKIAHPFLSADFIEQEKDNIRNIYLPNTQTWVYEQEERVIGFISMIQNEVGAIFLQPGFHGQGIGKQLMDYVADRYEELEVEVFEKNTIGRAFYDRYGFLKMHDSMHQPTGQKLIRMKYLPNSKKE